MELRHEFTVPVPVDEAWKVLLDIERVAPCMPGATVESIEGETVKGSVKVKVGPITVTYRGTAVFEEKDETARRIVLAARGKEVRGQGTARATVTGTLAERDGQTVVTVVTDLAITGRPAQFGRGVMAEVGEKIIGQFASSLSDQLAVTGEAAPDRKPTDAVEEAAEEAQADRAAAPEPRTAEPYAAGSQTAADTARPVAPRQAEPIDLISTAGGPIAKRAGIAALVLAAVAALVAVLRRRRR